MFEFDLMVINVLFTVNPWTCDYNKSKFNLD